MLDGVSNANQIVAESWSSMSQAPALFWFVIGLVVAALLVFIVWAGRSGHVPRSITPGVLGGLVGLFIVWTFFLYLVPAMTAATAPPTERTWRWGPGELLQDPGGSGLAGEPYRGYQLYVANACVTCHTMYVRPQDLGTGWAEGVDAGDVVRASDYVAMPSPPMGTQRNGPDLTYIGRRIPDMTYQIDHLVDPRKYKPNSIMPTYRHLSERDLRDLAAFLVTLGNEKEALMSKSAPAALAQAELSPSAKLGSELYRSKGCVGCHSLDGKPNVGPTWQGLWGKEEQMNDGTTVTVDREYLRESIVDPGAKIVKGFPAVMPPFSNLTQEEIDALIDFIEATGSGAK